MYCAHCGERVIENSNFCSSCGQKVHKEIPKESIHPGEGNQVAPNMEQPEKSLTEVYVGPNYSYYKNKWEFMDQRGTSISGNIAAFFFGVFWLGYRKMYKVLLIIAAIYIAIDFLLVNLLNYQYSTEQFFDPVDRLIGFGTSIILAMFGNKIYQNHVEKKVSTLKINTTTEQAAILAKHKGSRSWLGVFVTAAIFVCYGVLSVWFIPSNVAHITSVKDGSFYDYPRETVGEAFDDFFDNGSWDYVSENSPYDVVIYTGQAFVDGDRYNVEVEFIIETDSFEIREVTIDGESFTSDEEINEFLYSVYD